MFDDRHFTYQPLAVDNVALGMLPARGRWRGRCAAVGPHHCAFVNAGKRGWLRHMIPILPVSLIAVAHGYPIARVVFV